MTCRFIGENSAESLEIKRKDEKELRKTKTLENLNEVRAECYVYGNKVAILTVTKTEPVAIIIENKEITKLFDVLFEMVWKNC